jgi:hypothetical protein
MVDGSTTRNSSGRNPARSSHPFTHPANGELAVRPPCTCGAVDSPCRPVCTQQEERLELDCFRVAGCIPERKYVDGVGVFVDDIDDPIVGPTTDAK